jgi:hypothetical protein
MVPEDLWSKLFFPTAALPTAMRRVNVPPTYIPG